MRILCSNDDGINAGGLETLERIARQLSDDVWTVAPEVDQSGMARSITLTRPLRIRKTEPQRYAVDGTPTDCVQLGVEHLLKDHKPDLILSGINNGANVAEDVTMSGTIAAAFQGMTIGIPSVALSQVRQDRNKPPFHTAEAHAPGILRKLLDKGWADNVVMNLNFPMCEPDEVEGVVLTRQGSRDNLELFVEERMDMRQRRYYWFGFSGKPGQPKEGTDIHALWNKKVSVTPLHLQLTDDATIDSLKDAF
ncbi:5'/3'-nucleotidase SurE [Parvularcula sp. ZS-1/3]|uniref:5'-nucleotidase SurE n=1 Tax=Parvularcula mediterranea TaxID=2732508 RepID=A0A7Y3RNG9_9PROT|nr:5'/3'-nucleotidase SurE [Parvularcula mediterranea]NNU17326.1 5'/3'-nucleotidase SurE [Parvularcula mediterranea]